MSLWQDPGVPHRGWECETVHDLGDEADSERATCQMCGKEEIRYVHVMSHNDYGTLEVGCICAENMSRDYVNPKARERILVNRAKRRRSWLSRQWRTSQKGNAFLNIDGKNVGVLPDQFNPGSWKIRIGSQFGRRRFPSAEAAKLALFDVLYPPVVRLTPEEANSR